jgi:monofunctional biosynthetic peptidoglycan transglycosylase
VPHLKGALCSMNAPMARRQEAGPTRARRRGGGLVRLIRLLLILVVVLLLVPYLLAPLYRFINPVSTLMLWRWVTLQRVERTWAPLEQISPALPRAVMVAEDGRFCVHRGVDFGELRSAFEDADDLSEMRGGSTIAQQTAKNLFLWQGRSVVRKVLEFPLALWLDLVLGKRRLMEVYLNIAEWGPNGQFGVEAGARHAFGKSAKELNEREAALLAAILPNPVSRSAVRPGPGVRRLSGIYQARAAKAAANTACIRR